MTTHTNGRRITTHEVTISTAAVEVKTLTISGKQMTLAVFRQLEEKSLFDPSTFEYCGLPWGRVNYCPKGTCTYIGIYDERPERCGEHLHIVWQQGERLYQCRVSRYRSEDLWISRGDGPGDEIPNRLLWQARYEALEALDQLFIAV